MPTDETAKVNPQFDAAVPTAVPMDGLEAAFVKLGGKTVRGATPRATAEPDPEAFAEHGGKYVGKIPVTGKV